MGLSLINILTLFILIILKLETRSNVTKMMINFLKIEQVLSY
uniref:Uncharacterized protein n=1 Tax=Meloidogyne enterolobii TaxID=390850 RepID=A0A6V7UQR8_MELEN|nr:unnamed protein product [Meloidogyne enterolobii]